MPGNAKTYTVEDLLASVKHRATVPTSQITYTDSDLLRFANEEIDENLGPLVLSYREEFYVVTEDVIVNAGQREYDIPYRAFGSKIRIIKPINSAGQEGYPIVPIPVDREFNNAISAYSSTVRGFYLKGDKIVLTPQSVGSTFSNMRIYFYLRPNNLVLMNRAAKITAIDTINNTVNVDKVPANINSSVLLDFVSASPPSYKIRSYDNTAIVSSAMKQITFTELPEGLAVGDYVCVAGETVCPQIPTDVHPLLEQSVACKVLEAQGDTEGLKNAYIRLTKIENRTMNLIDNRIESPGQKVVNTNTFIRSRGRGRWGNF